MIKLSGELTYLTQCLTVSHLQPLPLEVTLPAGRAVAPAAVLEIAVRSAAQPEDSPSRHILLGLIEVLDVEGSHCPNCPHHHQTEQSTLHFFYQVELSNCNK